MSIPLKDLKARLRAGETPQAEIISLEGSVYLVRIDDELLARGSETLRYPSAHAAARMLGGLGLEAGWLVHESPYDEMIGRPDEHLPRPGPLRTPMSFANAAGDRS